MKKIFLVMIAQSVCALRDSFNFSVATSNMLDDTFYTGHIQNQASMMPHSLRTSLVENAFSDPQQFAQKDILALQEYDPTLLPTQELSYERIISKSGLSIFYNPVTFKLITHTYAPFSVKGATDRGTLIALLQPAKLPHERLLIVNTHFKGGTGPHNNYNSFRKDQLSNVLKNIDHFIQNNTLDRASIKIIICGDFNSDANNQALYQALQESISQSGFSLINSATLFHNKFPGTEYAATEYTSASIDYLWHSSNLHLAVPITYFPADASHLISHGKEDDALKTFFSDHKIITAHFDMPSSNNQNGESIELLLKRVKIDITGLYLQLMAQK